MAQGRLEQSPLERDLQRSLDEIGVQFTVRKAKWPDLLKEGYAGIYFLEPYAKDKTPVLFVHGIGGSPRDLEDIIAALDRRRFQPWLMNYPSGLDIRALGDGLVGLLAEDAQVHGQTRHRGIGDAATVAIESHIGDHVKHSCTRSQSRQV